MGKASMLHSSGKGIRMSTVTMTVSMSIDTEKDLVGLEMELDGAMAAQLTWSNVTHEYSILPWVRISASEQLIFL